MIFNYPIAISLSPNTQSDDIWQTIVTLCQPWIWQEGEAIEKIEMWFKHYFHAKEAISFNSGRSALLTVLQALDITAEDEILIQAFTCVALVEPIIWLGAKPVYLDIDKSLNIDYEQIEKHITHKTKAIIVQHTFGFPARIDMIKKIAQKHNLILLEDCAHSLGATYQGKKLGSFADIAFFSFGRDKVISSVFGGVAIINEKPCCRQVRAIVKNQKLRNFHQELNYPNLFWIFQQLLHPIAFVLILPLYNLAIGKLLLYLLLKLRLLSKPIYQGENLGRKPPVFPAKYPNALANLLLLQLKKLEKYNQHRKKIAKLYFSLLKENTELTLPVRTAGAGYLRFNLFSKKAKEIFIEAKTQKILLGNWYHHIIDPSQVNYEKVGYQAASCPKAERAAKECVNLPTYIRISEKEVVKITNLLNNL